MNYLKYFLFSLIFLWLFGFLYVFRSGNFNSSLGSSDRNNDGSQENEMNANEKKQILTSFKDLENELKRLEAKNEKNELVIQNLQNQARKLSQSNNGNRNKITLPNEFPSKYFEETRRKIFNDVKDISFYINARIDDNKNRALIKENFNDRINLILAELYNMSTADHLGEWRKQEAIKLTNRVQNRFKELQNPTNCNDQKKIICDLNKACGFGCQVHHVMYCFITAYYNNRTMILESANWRYNTQGFEAYFQPMSQTCTNINERVVDWNDETQLTAKSIRMPIIDVIGKRPRYFPLSIPHEYENELVKFHGDPFIWWAGQILFYLMRFNAQFQQVVDKKSTELNFKNSCIGVHVRRTDKVGTEAAFHGLDEYMQHVDSYFKVNDLKHGSNSGSKHCVYLASDELEVLKEAQTKYKQYEFVFDELNAKTASVHQRYSPESAQGVILDIYFLSQCEYLVCTFSSQVCRLAYELMQTRFPDASWRFRSLDDVYYFGGQNGHVQEVLYDHKENRANSEIELKKGDLIELAGNHWNGLSKGTNKRTNVNGLFPSYKVRDVIQVY